jgi:DNA-3-methyladenine glycosylase I
MKDFYVAYHDEEWGVPEHGDRRLFEFLVLEGAQAGLSWETILRKRKAYRQAFAGFDPVKVARFGKRDVKRLLGDEGIVRNRLKIESAIKNARAFLELKAEAGSFAKWIWAFVDGEPIQNQWKSLRQIPPRTELSDRISKELKQRGFSFASVARCVHFPRWKCSAGSFHLWRRSLDPNPKRSTLARQVSGARVTRHWSATRRSARARAAPRSLTIGAAGDQE